VIPRLTLPLIEDICNRIKAGAFEQVAVESLHVPLEVFEAWLVKGGRKRAPPLYRRLAEGVRQARAHARLLAEIATREDDPKIWLLHGPGRETPTRAGWGSGSRGVAPADDKDLLWELCMVLLAALAPWPEARAVAARAIAAFGLTDPTKPQAKGESS
jgi:hypothetical protein